MSELSKNSLKPRQIARMVADRLKEKDITKSISYPKRTFYITDDDGNCKSFSVKAASGEVKFTVEDIDAILGTFYEIVEECIRTGQPIYIYNKYAISLKYVQPRIVRVPTGDRQVYHVPGFYAPRFVFGAAAKRAARIYGESLEDGTITKDPVYDEDDTDFAGDFLEDFKDVE